MKSAQRGKKVVCRICLLHEFPSCQHRVPAFIPCHTVLMRFFNFASHPLFIFHLIRPHAIPTYPPYPTHPIPSTPPPPDPTPTHPHSKITKNHTCHVFSVRFSSCRDCRLPLQERFETSCCVARSPRAVSHLLPASRSHDGHSYFAGFELCGVRIGLSADVCCFGILGAEGFVELSADPIVVYRCVQGDRCLVGGTEEDARREGAAR